MGCGRRWAKEEHFTNIIKGGVLRCLSDFHESYLGCRILFVTEVPTKNLLLVSRPRDTTLPSGNRVYCCEPLDRVDGGDLHRSGTRDDVPTTDVTRVNLTPN